MTFVWLVSYPKSGNTWLRAFFSNYLHGENSPIDINAQLVGTPLHLTRQMFDETMGIASSNLSSAELDQYRPSYHRHFIENYPGSTFTKVHDSYYSRWTGKPLFPAHHRCKAIYLTRNPLDIVPSYAHHEASPIDRIIDKMTDPHARVLHGETAIDEHLGTWSQHVSEWREQSSIETMVVRYEDMLSEPQATFSSIIEYAGLEPDIGKLQCAIKWSHIDQLKMLEGRDGFQEGSIAAPSSFFRNGKSGEGLQSLNKDQIARIFSSHGPVMKTLGYV